MLRLWVVSLAVVSLVALGCKSGPAYVGSYGVVQDEAFKSQIAKAEAKMPQLSKAQQDAFKVQMSAAAEITLTINSDGTFTQANPGIGHDVHGTYTVDGNELTLSVAGSNPQQGPLPKVTFHPGDHTLTMTASDGTVITLKRK